MCSWDVPCVMAVCQNVERVGRIRMRVKRGNGMVETVQLITNRSMVK